MNGINIDMESLKLSGKGIIIDEFSEWKQDNIKMTAEAVEFHEVIGSWNDTPESRIGWISNGNLNVIADFTSHTKEGMVGKSVQDQLEWFMILDPNNNLSEFLDYELTEVVTEETEKLFQKYISENNFNLRGRININDSDLELDTAFVLISIKSNLIYVQSPKNSIRIAKDGIFILNLLKDSFTSVNSEDGVNIIQNGNNIISIGKNSNIIIDGKEFNPKEIVEKVTNSIDNMMSSLKF